MKPRSDYYRMPPDPFISFKYCDFFKLLKKRLNPKVRLRYKKWNSAIQLGEVPPELDLKGDDGKSYRLSDLKGKKNVVLVFGAIT